MKPYVLFAEGFPEDPTARSFSWPELVAYAIETCELRPATLAVSPERVAEAVGRRGWTLARVIWPPPRTPEKLA